MVEESLEGSWLSLRSLILVFSVFASPLLQAASADAVAAKLTTGFLPQETPGHFWAMATAYRASFSPDGIQLVRHGHRAAIRFPGARLRWSAEGAPLASVNFLGAAPRSLNGSAAIRAANAYPGVDIVLRMQDGRLKSEFQLAPGADPASAGYCVDGAHVQVDSQRASLSFDAGADWRWTEEGLVSWQSQPDGTRVPVASSFTLHGSCVGFQLGAIDPALPLTIDPDLVFSSYLGGGLFDAITAIATDAQGNTYVGGWTESSDFPVVSGYQGSSSGRIDGFVAKINSIGQLQFSTYLGGSSEDRVLALTVSGASVITVAGHTTSSNFPTASPAFASLAGGRDAFVSRLSATGNSLLFSTFLGGSGNDAALGIAVDPGGTVVVVGETGSTNFPTQYALSSTNAGGVDGFVTRLSSSGAMLSGTYFGGASDDRIRAVAVSPDGNLHVTGATASSNLLAVNAPYPSLRGSMDAFYARFNAPANGLAVSTYLGGSGGTSLNEESGYGIVIDTTGRAWIAGVTPSADFPGVSGGYQSSYGGGVSDAFVAVFSTGTTMDWATYIGGTGLDAATSIAAGSGFVGLAGYTTSTNLPLSGALQTARAGEYDAFWAAFPTTSTMPLYISYLGGTGSDSAVAAAASGSSLTIAGTTLSANFPLVTPTQAANPGSYGAFASRIRFGPGPITASPSSGAGLTQTFQFTVSHANGNASIANAEVLFNASYSFVNGCHYSLDRANNILRLFQDAGSIWLSAVIGSGTVLNNGLCATSANAVTVSTTASAMVFSFPVSFSASFAGAKNIYANATDTTALGAGWPQVATWSVVVAATPAPDVPTPSTGAGLSQSFSFPFNDANGAADIATVYILINSGLSTANGCYMVFNRGANTLSLLRDSDSAMLPLTPGANTTVANANCSIAGSGVSVTAAGSQLTLVVPITFQPSFSGTRSIYAFVTDAGNLSSGWQTVGSWTPTPNYAPTVTSVAPATGGGGSQLFTVTFNDPNGFIDIATAAFLVQTSVTTQGACYITYSRTANVINLFRDSDSSFLSVTPGTATSVENANCSLSGAGMAISGNGSQLTLVLPISFKPSFAGTRNLYAAVTDAGALSSGWQSIGSWTPTPIYTPAVVSSSPASGGGATQAFTITLSDGNGFNDIASAAFLWQTTANTLNACYITYFRATNTFGLFRDSDSAFLPITPGAATTVENLNCSLSGTGLSVSGAGTQLTFVLPLTFKPAFTGTRNIYAAVTDAGGLASGWQSIGAWNPFPAYAPTVAALSPSAGTGVSQAFNFQYTDGNGNADIAALTFIFNATPNAATGCYITFSRAANTLSLYNPADSTWSSLTPGSATTIQNNYCSIPGATVSSAASGDSYYFNLPITFKPPSFGPLTIFTIANDQSGASSGWIAAGTWTAAGAAPPVISSLTPASGAVTAQTFTATVTDPNGSADISTVLFLINPSTSTANGCYLSYSRAANTVSLFQDSNASWLPITVGTATTVANDFCTLSGAGLTVTPVGNSLTIAFPLTFKPTFTGVKTTYLSATDAGGLTTGWVSVGSWTLIPPSAPALNSLSPSSGSGGAQTFTFVFSDLNGYTDIGGVLLLVNASLNGRGGCYIAYDRATNLFYLYRDSDNAWIVATPGSGTNVANDQCTINAATLSTSVSGNTLTVTLPLVFSGSFTGLKNVFANVSDVGGLSSGWLTAGTWNPGQPAAPIVTSLTPSSGTGLAQTFTITLSDTNGFADIASALFVINPALNGLNSCYISFNRAANAFYLYRDSVNVWQLVYPGTNTGAANNNCALAGTGLTVTATATSLTITLPLTFSASYTGANNFYVYVADSGGLNSGWITAGTWSTGQPAAPTVTSVTPNAGSGPSQAFSVILSDTNGNADISSALLLVNSTLNGQNACFISYNRAANAFYLFRDSDNAWQLIYPGSSGSVTNGYCTISGAALSSAASGNTLTLNLPLSFSSNFTGSKNFYAYAADAAGLNSGWITLGTWNPSATSPPAVTSITPSSGAGSSQTFTLTLSDANGNADIASALVLINSTLNGNGACFISYNRAVNAFYLLRDSDAVWQPVYPGTATSVTNDNCTLSGAALAATASGNTLTLVLPISFKPVFAGPRNTYVSVTDAGGLNSGVVTAGTWTVN
jgi:hypothetical protein